VCALCVYVRASACMHASIYPSTYARYVLYVCMQTLCIIRACKCMGACKYIPSTYHVVYTGGTGPQGVLRVVGEQQDGVGPGPSVRKRSVRKRRYPKPRRSGARGSTAASMHKNINAIAHAKKHAYTHQCIHIKKHAYTHKCTRKKT
jgi:hypothetical protein